MKSKVLLKSMIGLIAIIALASCNDVTTDGIDKVTYYPTLTLQGDGATAGTYFVLAVGDTYVDPGYTSSFNGEDTKSEVKVVSNVDTSEPGMYEVAYSVKSTDGFVFSKTRNVVVAGTEPIMEDLSGAYKSMVVRTNNPTGTGNGGPYPVVLKKLTDGLYTVDDLMGGFYRDGRGIGSVYVNQGVIFVKSSGVVIQVGSSANPWGEEASLVSPAFDVTSHTFTWDALTLGYTFHVTLVKN